MFRSQEISNIHETIVGVIKKFFSECGCDKAVIGLSGGIDSAVVAALATNALGNKCVHGIIMPSAFSSQHSITDAVDLANNLGITYDIIGIEDIYDKFMHSLSPIFENDNSWDTTQENIQARIRGSILMAYANRKKALVLNTSNKSELSMGYGTLYGDLAGALMVIADIYKLEVYDLARYINKESIKIPISSIEKAPSAELRPDQKDSDSLPEYEVLDPILYMLNEGGESIEDIRKKGFDFQLINRIHLIKSSANFKKHQLAPLIKISSKPLLESHKWVM